MLLRNLLQMLMRIVVVSQVPVLVLVVLQWR